MNRKKLPARFAAAILAAGLLAFSATPALAARRYDDFEAITSHVNAAVPQALAIASPSGDIHTTSSAYYITGTSDPSRELFLDGSPVEGRGIYGSFGVYVHLSPGVNTFTFSQGDASRSVSITYNTGGQAATTSTITKMTPQYDSGYDSGSTLTLSCVAPAGGFVTASVGGATVELSQVAAAQSGVPARFKGELTIPEASGIQDLGPVVYTLSWQGKTKELSSAGRLFAVGRGSTLLVQVKETSSNLYPDGETDSKFLATAKAGAVDAVVAQNELRYQLAMGGWINKDTVTPLVTGGSNRNMVSGVAFSRTQWGERYKFTGTVNPVASTSRSGNKLIVELHHTSGISSVPVGQSQIFGDCTVTQGEDSTVLEFTLAPGKELWGYTVEYKDNITTLYCKYKATLSSDPNLPLKDIIIALDAGHGGTDPGAFGTAALTGPVEKDLNRATAEALRKRLESLGATVILPAAKDSKSTVQDRMQAAHDEKADLFISLHCNSVAGNGLKARGTEIYYYEDIAKPFAQTLQKNLAAGTGRTDRGAKFSNFRVTLNTLAPAVLVEMGFISHPQEYDQMCSRQGIFDTVNSLADGVLEFLA